MTRRVLAVDKTIRRQHLVSIMTTLSSFSELLPVRTKTIGTLAQILPELDKGEPAEPPPGDPRGGGDGGSSPAELGIPLWWARRSN